MRGRMPSEYKLSLNERHYLTEVVKDGQLIQRIANRARVLLALDRGERIVEILRWTGLSRMGVWHLWQRYLERSVEAIFDEDRSGRPEVFSPARTRPDRARGLHRASRIWIGVDSLGLPQSATSSDRGGDC
ncbi:MAG: helix-turn-helix domain-containing protein [Acidobacteria bacterium]|nr:helix-turn-helix domain-containing protein [Acidobacteriota bacterium]